MAGTGPGVVRLAGLTFIALSAGCWIDLGRDPSSPRTSSEYYEYDTVQTSADNAVLTCDKFDGFLAGCYPDCVSSGWDCPAYYDGLDPATQLDLDDCSDCLYANDCADCDIGGWDCFDLLGEYLGVSCGW